MTFKDIIFEEEASQYNVNDYFKEKFVLNKDKVLYKNPDIPYANNVIYKSLLIYGNPGSGKTTTINSIAGMFVDEYGIENINARFKEDGNLEPLIYRGLAPKMVNLLFADNATLREQSKEVLNNYFTLRQRFFDKFNKDPWNLSNGYILNTISIHRYHGINTNFRSTVEGIIVKDISLNPYDRRAIASFVGNKELMEMLDEIVDLRFDDRALMNYSLLITRNKVGLLYLEPRKEFYFSEPLTLADALLEHGRKLLALKKGV